MAIGAFDPELKKQGITDLSHTSRLDEAIWHEFDSAWGKLVIEADRLRQQKTGQTLSTEIEPAILEITGPTERVTTAKQRIYQNFFRASVLSGFNRQCCICGLPHPEILIASHIVPWSVQEEARVNPQNGLCLCASHDVAFERELSALELTFQVCFVIELRNQKTPLLNYYLAHLKGKVLSFQIVSFHARSF